jgi:hypothetical protein
MAQPIRDETPEPAAAPDGSPNVQIEGEQRPFFYDLEEIPGYTIEQMSGDSPDREMMFDAFGKDLLTKTILHSPHLSVFHEVAPPNQRVKPHRHGTHQLTYVLSGELIYGKRRTKAGMGVFTPNTWYSWRAGDEGAEWLEIHAGLPGVFRPPVVHRNIEEAQGSIDHPAD